METKKCRTCGCVYNIDKFGKDKRRKDGLTSACKACIRIDRQKYYTKYKDTIKRGAYKYYLENKDKVKEYHAKWAKEHYTPIRQINAMMRQQEELMDKLFIQDQDLYD